MTKEQATRKWVEEFNRVPTNVIKKLAALDYYEVEQVTPWEENDERLEWAEAQPMWGWMWTFNDITDAEWLEKHLKEVHECGFRIYYQQDYGYLLGIDGAGYDFYEEHWIPLYEARGLKWHE